MEKLIAPQPPGRPAVLLVDDEELLLGLYRTALRAQGFEVRTASNGRQAVELYRQERAGIGLVILDLTMPGPDGVKTLRALRDVDPSVRCWFATGEVRRYTDEGLLAEGALGVLKKPFPVGDLIATVREALPAPPQEARRAAACIPA
jgi:DNA-binding response OmpR family regulator